MSRRREMAGPLARAGVFIHPLGLGLPGLFRRLKAEAGAGTIRIDGWMYHGNLLAMLIRSISFRDSPLVWHVRQSLDNYGAMRPRTRLVLKACGLLSRRVPRILFNSEKALADHVERGWSSSNCSVWYNGFDPAVFEGRKGRRAELRLRLGAGSGDTVLLSIGRYHPDKDYDTLLAAVQPLLRDNPRLHLVLIGKGLESGNRELAARIDNRLSPRLHLLGPQDDVASWLAAADLFILHSRAESFPNVLGEAVFSRCLCIATRVGDVDQLLPGRETQVPAGDAGALCRKIQEVLSWPRPRVHRYIVRCYRNALRRFSLEKSAEQYLRLTGAA